MTRFKTLGRLGTLCSVTAIVVLTAGCPFPPNPCRGFNVNDNNPCTTDTCRVVDGKATAVHTPIANCCDTAADCNDNDVCTTDTCANISTSTGRGTCAHAAVADCCNDNDDCDADDVCVDNECVTVGTACDSDDDCPEGEECDETAGECVVVIPACEDDADCDDFDGCTTDTCVDGDCVFTDVTCDAGEVCVDGECVSECTDDTDCADDGDACTTVACVGGGCVTTTEDCDDGVDCTDDSCDPATGSCTNEDNCVDGTCDPATGECTGCESDADCNDDDDCTDDACVDGTCENTNNTASCSDNNPCTTGDVCTDGTCAGTPVNCPSGQSCNPSTGNCQDISCTTAADCNDNATCTTDVCNQATGECEYTPIDAICEDNLFCTGTEGAGSCNPDDPDAEAATGCVRSGDPCEPIGKICNEASDACDDCTTNAQCADDFTCTSDTCAAGTCVHTNVDSSCPDLLKCDGVDVCDPTNPDADETTGCFAPGDPCCPQPGTGLCLVCDETTYVEGDPNTCEQCASNADCNDGITCTQDACNGATGECSHTDTNTLCPDTLFCNGDDICDPTDPDADATTGCVNGLETAYPCANACNEATNACFNCTSNLDCSDGVPCTTDTCDGATGLCTHTDNCTGGEICNLQSGDCE